MKTLLKRALPWLVGFAIVIVIIARVPFDAFRTHIHDGNHIALAAIDLLVVLVVLATDTFATWIALIAVRLRWSVRDVFVVRGATYMLALVNYAVGQGGMAYYFHKSGVAGWRATGVALFMMGTTFAALIGITTVTWMIDAPMEGTMWWTLVAGCIGFAIYLAIIAMAPGALVRRELLAPLFEARVRGNIGALVARLPHVTIIVLGHWLAMVAWGIDVPLSVAAVTMPAVVIAAVLPISPAGLGTTQAALVYFFSAYATGPTEDARNASILAFSIVHFVYGVLATVVVGGACLPFARKAQPMRAL
jgi:hypothetical protein